MRERDLNGSAPPPPPLTRAEFQAVQGQGQADRRVRGGPSISWADCKGREGGARQDAHLIQS